MTNEKPQPRVETSDLISRADVLCYIDRLGTCGLGKGKALEYIRKYVEKADSVSAERVGEWIEAERQDPSEIMNGNAYFICSCCGAGDLHATTAEVPYCWKCGAKMED